MLNNINTAEMPRERLQRFGVSSLSFRELLQLILGSGSRGSSITTLTSQVLKLFPDTKSLVNASFQELCSINGLGNAKAASLIASIELGLRLKQDNESPNKINCPLDVFNLVSKDLMFKSQEVFMLLSLDSRNRVIAKDIIAVGGISSVAISTREVIQSAFKRNASSIIICHNHPSNDPTPSKEDETVTTKLALACKHVEIPLIDHIIVGGNNYISLKSLGLIDTALLIKKGGEND